MLPLAAQAKFFVSPPEANIALVKAVRADQAIVAGLRACHIFVSAPLIGNVLRATDFQETPLSLQRRNFELQFLGPRDETRSVRVYLLEFEIPSRKTPEFLDAMEKWLEALLDEARNVEKCSVSTLHGFLLG